MNRFERLVAIKLVSDAGATINDKNITSISKTLYFQRYIMELRFCQLKREIINSVHPIIKIFFKLLWRM